MATLLDENTLPLLDEDLLGISDDGGTGIGAGITDELDLELLDQDGLPILDGDDGAPVGVGAGGQVVIVVSCAQVTLQTVGGLN